MSDLNKKPAQVNATRVDNTKLLPTVLATEPNKKMIESTLDLMTSKGQLLPFKETYGSRTATITEKSFFKEEIDPVRQESSSNMAIIANTSSGEFKSKVSYLDIENYFKVKGLPLRDGVQLDSDIFNASFPMAYRNITDFQLFYWLEFNLPAARLHADEAGRDENNLPIKKYSVSTDIVGQPYALIEDDITGRKLELLSGMYVYFTGVQDEEYLTTDINDPVVFRVIGASESISLIRVSDYDERIPRGYLKKRPWDKLEKTIDPPAIYWDSESWDGAANVPVIPEYVVMTRYATDNNPWSVLDRWYHIATIRMVAEFLDVSVEEIARPELQAKRPIIYFTRNIKLYNWPRRHIGDINSLLNGSISDFTGRISITDSENYTLTNGNRVVFAKTSGIWEVSGVGTGITFNRIRNSVDEDGAIIVTVSEKLYYRVIFKNGEWSFAQNKTEANQTPLFEFYGSNGESLEARENTTFRGGVILGFKEGDVYDPVLDKKISVSNIDFDVVNERNTSVISANQIQFYTDIDKGFIEFDSTTSEDVEFKEPWGYRIGNRINPFYVRSQGLGATPSLQDFVYTAGDESLSVDVVPPAEGFSEIHLYPENDNISMYYNIDGIGIVPFTTRRGLFEAERFLPFISGSVFKIHCHNLEFPVYFKKFSANKSTELNEYQITNNGISNGIIEINLAPTYVENNKTVANDISTDNSRLTWTYANSSRVAIVRDIEDWRFIFSAYSLDKTNPIYSNYDFTVEDNVPLTFTRKIVPTTALSRKIKTGTKIGIETFVKTNSVDDGAPKRTAPLSLTVNPLNAEFSNINYYSLYQHTGTAINASPNAREMIDPSTKSYHTTQRLSGGTLIKHNSPLARFAVAATALPFDFSEIVVRQGKHYDVFHNRLKTELIDAVNNFDTSTRSTVDVLSLALENIYINQKDDSAFWYHSNMLGWGSEHNKVNANVPESLTVALLGNLDVIPHAAGKELLLHISYNGKLLTRNVDYTLESELAGYYTKIRFSDFYNGKSVTIQQWPETFKSRIPASLSKIGLAPCYVPEIYLDATYTNKEIYFLIRHDGTRYYLESGAINDDNGNLYPVDIIDQLLYEYEKAVWSSIAYDIEFNDKSSLFKGQPGGFRTTRNEYHEVLELVNNEMYSWMQENRLYVLENKNYDVADPFTYRYQLGSGDGAGTITGTWRAIYRYFYDTDRPHTHPWEMLGYTVKPAWWDNYYSWTDANKRAALEVALRTGNTAEPPMLMCKPWLARNNDLVELQEFPVDNSGNLIPPTELTWLADGLFVDDQDWAPGDYSSYEVVFRSTQRGLASTVKAVYLSNPVEFVNLNWQPGESKLNEWGHRVNVTNNYWLTPEILHDYHRKELSEGRVNFSAGMESLFVEFCVLNNKDYVSEIVDVMANLTVNKEFLLSGFSNKNNVRVQSSSASNQSKSLFVPEENYKVRTLRHYPEREEFFSALRIVWDGESWNIFGFNNEQTSFNYYEPRNLSATIAHTIGDYLIKEKTQYDTSVKKILRYGASFTDRQSIFDFIIGYGKYLESQGFIFDEVESADVRNWQLSAKQFVFWSNDPLAPGNYIDLNPAANGLKIQTIRGQLCSLEGTDLNVGQVIDRFGKPLFSKDLVVSRRNPFTVTTKDTNRGIYGIKLAFETYESVLHLDGTSIFNDVYFLPEQATSKRNFTLGGKRSQAWDGTYWVPGYAFSNLELIPNFETMSEVGRNLLDVENVLNDKTILEASRSQFGLQRNPELRQLFLSEDSETLFKTGIAFDKGTRKVFNSIEPLTHDDGTSVVAYEEYMVRTGEIGNTKGIEYFEFQLGKTDIKSDTQIIKFVRDVEISERKTYITDNSRRWVDKPFGKQLRFKTFDYPYTELKTSGPINNGDTDYIANSVDDIKGMFAEFEPLWSIPAYDTTARYKKNDLVRVNGKLYIANTTVSQNTWAINKDYFTSIREPFLPNIYVKEYVAASNEKPASWQILQLMDMDIGITEACPGIVDTDKARINTNKNANVKAGDMVLIVNADNGASSVNGIWTVDSTETTVESGVTKYFFYLDTNIPGTIKTGKVFVFRPVRFSSEEELETTSAALGYVWDKKFNPKENIIDNANIVPPNTPSGFSAVKPISVIDDALASAAILNNAAEAYSFGNYTVLEIEPDGATTPVKIQSRPVDPSNIEQLLLYSYEEGKTLAKIDLFDPKKGKLPTVFLNDIDVINRVDPAKYTKTTDTFKTVYGSSGWFGDLVGRRWWDTSTIQFQDYENGTDFDRAKNWGSTIDNVLPDIYEWTKSTVHPSKWETMTKTSADVFGVRASGEAYYKIISGSKYYYWTEEIEYKSGKAYTVYYFWVKNKNDIPTESKMSRVYSTSQLSKVLLNPSAAGLPWWAPISNTAMIVHGVDSYVPAAGAVVQIKFKNSGSEKNQQWTFVAEGNPLQIIPEWMHIRLRDSLATTKKSRTAEDITTSIASLVPNITRLHPYNRLGNEVRPYLKSWFADAIEARRVFIKRTNELLLNMDLVNGVAGWDKTIGQNNYQWADEVIDLSIVWRYEDFVTKNFDSSRYVFKTVDTQVELYNTTAEPGTYVKVNNDNAIYEKEETGGWTVVKRFNGTIQFIDDLFNKRSIGGWDPAPWENLPWDYNLNAHIHVIVDALRNDIFKNQYVVNYSFVMCSMFRYILSEQLYVDWLAKSSTILPYNTIGLTFTTEEDLVRDNISALNGFFSTVKSFRDKTRGGDITKNTLEDASTKIDENKVFNITLNYNRFTKDERGEEFIVPREEITTTIRGIDFVPVGWDATTFDRDYFGTVNAPMSWDSFGSQADFNQYLQKIYNSTVNPSTTITGSDKSKYFNYPHREEEVVARLTDAFTLDVTQNGITVRQHYFMNFVSALILDSSKTALTASVTNDATFIGLENMDMIPDANPENPAIIWIGNEKIIYTIKETTGISGLIRGAFGTPACNHTVDTPVYVESATTSLHGYVPMMALNNNAQFYNDPGLTMSDSVNTTAKTINNYSGS